MTTTTWTRWAFITTGCIVLLANGPASVAWMARDMDRGWTTFGFEDGTQVEVRGSWDVQKVLG